MTLSIREVVMALAHFDLDVSFETQASSTALFGPSGAGKTSLLEVIAGVRSPMTGAILLDGRDLTALPPRDRRIGYVPQDAALFPHLTVRQNILYGARARDGRFTLDHVVGILEIGPLTARAIGRLSGGERKRVALARALLRSPDLLLLDEPLAGVDVALRDRVLDQLVAMRRDFPIPLVYVTHDLREAAALCEEVVVLERGRVVEQRAL